MGLIENSANAIDQTVTLMSQPSLQNSTRYAITSKDITINLLIATILSNESSETIIDDNSAKNQDGVIHT